MFPVSHHFEAHCHSACSDGALSPVDLVAEARFRGVDTLAITDHDNFQAVRSLKQSDVGDIRLIPAMEMSVVWRRMTLHVLTYGFPPDDPGHLAFESLQNRNRHLRAERIVFRLERKLGLTGLMSEARRIAGGTPGRPHIAQVLLGRGVVRTHAEAFDKWLGQGRMGDVKSHWPTLEEAMDMTRNGIRVLAHPVKYRMTATRLRACLSDFRALGGEGVEVACPGISSGWYGQLQEMARKQGLLVSGGSDFHRPGSWVVLGRYPRLPDGLPNLYERLGERV